MERTASYFYSIPLVALLSVFVGNAQYQRDGATDEKPNIIFILTDDQRFDALGYTGNPLISTPEMDRLAKEGTFFENAMVTTPICAASRASILTGLYERTHRFDFSTGNIRAEYMEKSYPTLLRKNGYQTGFFGKYGVLYDHLNEQFDVFESYDRNNTFPDRRGYYYKTLDKDTVHLTRYTGQKALDFISETDSERPFCLSLSFSAPHAHDPAEEQYFWQKESDGLLEDTDIPVAELGADKYFEALPEIVRNGFNRLRWSWRYDTPEKYQHSVKGYYRMISDIDREIAKIRQLLKERGLDKNTVIILMGDNGYFLGERQLAGKWLMYDNSIRVPLIVFDPRIEEQEDSQEMALNVDVPSTILDLAGLDAPASWQGKSLLPLVSGQTNSLKRDTVLIEHLWEFDDIPPSEGIRTAEWKYFRYINDKSLEELYHLEEDAKEIENLAENPLYAEKLQKFRNATDRMARDLSDSYSEGPIDLSVASAQKSGGTEVHGNIPRYAWELSKGTTSQSAYQILVASSQEHIENNVGDMWNSKQVKNDTSSGIKHVGNTLEAGTTYFWKVRIWDEEHRTSRYSETQSFTLDNDTSIKSEK